MIRAATTDDAAAIASIHVRGWQRACQGLLPEAFLSGLSVEHRRAIWHESLQRPVPEVLVAEVQGTVRGWICFGPSRDTGAAATTAELWALYIDPDHWRQGLGLALWRAMEDQLRRSHFLTVTLWVLKDNLTAVRFYEAMGFRLDPGGKRPPTERGGVTLEEIRMELQRGPQAASDPESR